MRRDRVVERLAPSKGRLHAPLDPEAALHHRQDALRGDYSVDPRSMARGTLTPAAVLVPLVDHQSGITVLLTQRTDHLNRHAGQIAFPGGRLEPEDPTAVAGALREAEEEIGLAEERVEVVGRLDDYVTGTGFVVAPVVGLITPPFAVRLDPMEVADVFEVPLDFFLDPANHRRETRMFKGVERRFWVMPYKHRYIWGATAAMLVNLYEVLSETTPAVP